MKKSERERQRQTWSMNRYVRGEEGSKSSDDVIAVEGRSGGPLDRGGVVEERNVKE